MNSAVIPHLVPKEQNKTLISDPKQFRETHRKITRKRVLKSFKSLPRAYLMLGKIDGTQKRAIFLVFDSSRKPNQELILEVLKITLNNKEFTKTFSEENILKAKITTDKVSYTPLFVFENLIPEPPERVQTVQINAIEIETEIEGNLQTLKWNRKNFLQIFFSRSFLRKILLLRPMKDD